MDTIEGITLGVNIGLFIGVTIGAYFLARVDSKIDNLRNELHYLARQMGHRISIPAPPAGMDPPSPPSRPRPPMVD